MHGKIIQVYITADTQKRLQFIADEMHREVLELAETSVSEAALEYFRGRKDDPAGSKRFQ